MLSRRQVVQAIVASSVAALTPSRVLSDPYQRIGSAANRAQIVDADFDVTPYLARLKSAGVKTIGRYYDRAYGTGIGETCYHHRSKVLSKAELAAIEQAGLSVYVVFQHCGAQCVNFDLKNKATADKGRKDAEGAVALARELGQPANTPIYFAIDYDPAHDSGCRLPADRIWPSIETYFDHVHEVLAHTRWQVGVYGAGATCQRLSTSGRAKYFWLSSRAFVKSGCTVMPALSGRKAHNTSSTGIFNATCRILTIEDGGYLGVSMTEDEAVDGYVHRSDVVAGGLLRNMPVFNSSRACAPPMPLASRPQARLDAAGAVSRFNAR